MLTPDDLIEYVRLERDAQEAETRLTGLLDDRGLVARGDAIAGLVPVAIAGNQATLQCVQNISRIRPGDRLELSSPAGRVKATLLDVRESGSVFDVRVPAGALRAGGDSWTARLLPTDLSPMVIQALGKLQPGAPGWGLFRALAGIGEPLPPPNAVDPAVVSLQGDLVDSSGIPLDDSQRDVFYRCLALPPILAVQGPPGTGKTAVLAFVAEALARRRKRVLVVAPTHQAVNNALSTIHALFPERAVIKVGDELRREALADDIPCGVLESAAKSALRLAHETITGMTFLSALHHLALRTSPLAPNVVIIDEAGQLPLSQGACAGLMGAGSTLMFGDDMQMPPVFSGEVAGDKRSISVFGQFRRLHPNQVPMLEMTYRLNDVLCRAIGETFYAVDGSTRLRPSPNAALRRLAPACAEAADDPLVAHVLDPNAPLVWVRSHAPSCTQLNASEARFVAAVLAAAISGGLSPERVAAVTPFRRQAMLIRGFLQARLGEETRLPIVDTVERVQGMTVDLMVISACASDPEYVCTLAGFLLSPNRLNVAASRARTKTVLTASPAVLAAIPEEYDALLAQRQWRAFLARSDSVLDLPTEA